MAEQTKTPPEGGAVSSDDAWVSELQVNAETIGLVVRSLAAELHDFAALGHVPSLSVQHQLQLVFDELGREAANLIRVTPVAAGGATDLLSVRTSFCPLAYRRAAEAAKDRIRNAINGE